MTAPSPHMAYRAALPAEHARALTILDAQLRALLPEVEEVISYQMPAFRLPDPPTGPNALSKRVVIGYAAFSKHLGLYPFSGSVIPMFANDITALGFKHSKSGITFRPDQPLPDDLLARIIAARLAEIG